MRTRFSELRSSDWKEALVRTYREVKKDNLSLISAGVAFYAFLSIFPALAAVLSIYGLAADPTTVQQHIQELGAVLPDEAQQLIGKQLAFISSSSSDALSLSAIIAILIALWSANKATKGLFLALSIVYGAEEHRGFLKINAQSLFTTAMLVVGTVLLLGLVAVVPALVNLVGLGELGGIIVQLVRWPLALLTLLVGLAILYRIGPDRRDAEWRWLTPGSIAAAIVWLLASIGLSLYVTYFGNYNETYGSVGAVVITLLWLFLSAYSVLLGGELNSELLRTQRDRRRGAPPARSPA
jgi:membrane protein